MSLSTIYDDKVGLLNLTGIPIDQAKNYLKNQFGRIYATLNGRNPSSYIDVSLGELRSINVNFVGEVNYPGVYPIHSFSSLITGLIQAGGVDTTGSLRNIIIKRGNDPLISVDLYNYFLKGDLPKNIQLRDQDIVFVPVRLSSVTIDSNVYRPGIYESKSGETIKELIGYAGGLKPNAHTVIEIKRIKPFKDRNYNFLDTESFYIDYSKDDINYVQDGDQIKISKVFESVNEVEIIGQVKRPGKYQFYNGMRLLDLIELSGGFNDPTFWKTIYQDQGELVRRNPDESYEKLIKINLNQLKNGNLASNLELKNLDRFVVHANRNFFEKENVQISGEVNIPGSYPLIKDNETLKSILQRSGGFTSKALKNGISIFRKRKFFEPVKKNQSRDLNDYYENKNTEIIDRPIRIAWQNESIILLPGDSIVVKEETGTVNVSGEVYNPGLIEFRDGKPLRYYLNSAGGLNEKGNRKGVIIVYPNGLIVPKKWYNSPKILEGSDIIVNSKEIAPPFNITQFATNWTSIISSLITAYILSQQIGNSG